jgi:RNA polymerase sigma-70 factor, ECF subfamily
MLYQKLGRPALAKTINLVSKSVAEEIVQDIFAKMWQLKMTFPNLKHAYAWVYKCCTNAAIDHLRNHGNSHTEISDQVQNESPLSWPGANDGVDLETKTQAQQLWKYLITLFDSEEAAVFVYRNFEGLTQDEVSEIMQISRRTVNRIQEKIDQKLEKVRRQQNG